MTWQFRAAVIVLALLFFAAGTFAYSLLGGGPGTITPSCKQALEIQNRYLMGEQGVGYPALQEAQHILERCE